MIRYADDIAAPVKDSEAKLQKSINDLNRLLNTKCLLRINEKKTKILRHDKKKKK